MTIPVSVKFSFNFLSIIPLLDMASSTRKDASILIKAAKKKVGEKCRVSILRIWGARSKGRKVEKEGGWKARGRMGLEGRKRCKMGRHQSSIEDTR